MQYLLTEKEFSALQEAAAKRESEESAVLQNLCTQVALLKPIKVNWRDGDDLPWGCILIKDPTKNPGYCDHCPVQEHCPYPHKEWSK